MLVVPWVALVIDAWGPIRDNSFLWHIRAGTVQAELGKVLTTDPFSFTRNGERWLTQSWLAELLYDWLEGRFGLGFVPWMILATSLLTFLGIGLIAHRESRSVTATAFVLVTSTLLLISFMVPRPVIFSFLLFVVTILAWDNRRSRWAVPFLLWIWASVHGSFVIGLAYIGLRLVSRREWKSLPGAVAAGVATLLTPHGLGVVGILLDFGEAREALMLLSEWRRPGFMSPVFLPFLGGVAFIVIGAYRRHVEYRHLWLVVPFLVLGFSSIRAVPPAWLGILPVVSVALRDLSIGSRRRLSRRPATIFAVVVLLIPFLLVDDAVLDEERFPVAASDALADVPTYHDDRTGGYLIWAEWPAHLVYLDDRAELYGERIAEFVEVRRGELAWEPVFRRDRIGQALLRTEEPIVRSLLEAGWVASYRDDSYVVLHPG